MKGKLKRPIAFLMTLALIFNMGFTAYAGAIPSNYNDKKLVASAEGEVPLAGSEEPTVTESVYYTVEYHDLEGNPLLEDKFVTDGTLGETVTEAAQTIDGYTPDAETKELALEAENNYITFEYTPIVTEPIMMMAAPAAPSAYSYDPLESEYDADTDVFGTRVSSPNSKTNITYLWGNGGNLYIAVIGNSNKPIKLISYNGTIYKTEFYTGTEPYQQIDMDVAGTSDDILNIEGFTTTVWDFVKTGNISDKSRWIVFNLGPQEVTSPFVLGVNTDEPGYSAWNGNELNVEILSDLQVYHKYGTNNAIFDIYQSEVMNANESYSVSKEDKSGYALANVTRQINGGSTENLGPISPVEGVAPNISQCSIIITFIYGKTYSVTYDANGGSGSMTDGESPYLVGEQVNVLSNGFTSPSGKSFDGWNTEAGGTGTAYAAGESFDMPAENVTLYAQWKSDQHNLTINYQYEDGTKAADAYTGSYKYNEGYSVASPAITGYTP
ncbi:MAG: InlB B-repeat-containing protein, partial [Pseudomonadota bacterium]